MMMSAIGSGNSRFAIAQRVPDYSTFEFALIDKAGNVTNVQLPNKLKPFGLFATTERHLIVQLAEPTEVGGRMLPAETLLSYDVTPQAKARVQVVYAPRADEYLNDPFFGFAGTRSHVQFVVQRQLVPSILIASIGSNGWSARTSHTGEPGTSFRLWGADPVGDDFIARTSGYLVPARLELIQADGAIRFIEAEQPKFDAAHLIVEVKSTPSKDGTPIDYFLVRPRTASAIAGTPTLMWGYGGFGITITPSYLHPSAGGPSLKLWFDRGGALAVPAIRGGGDRGSQWHRAAMREHKQLSYDDFIAVAEALIKSGFTHPDKLGVFGSSNGGLLSATVGTQRPDLFGAVICDVPVTDMLRFPKMGIGAALMDEYGNPDDPAMARVLRAYSPFHNVHAGAKYPPFLVTISTEDNRVGPGHARKFAAKLAQVGAPVYFLEYDEGGHGLSAGFARPDLQAMRIAFLVDALGVATAQ
jgi:prolyl oligopeptidase